MNTYNNVSLNYRAPRDSNLPSQVTRDHQNLKDQTWVSAAVVVSVLPFYSDDRSSNLAKLYSFNSVKMLFENNKKKKKRPSLTRLKNKIVSWEHQKMLNYLRRKVEGYYAVGRELTFNTQCSQFKSLPSAVYCTLFIPIIRYQRSSNIPLFICWQLRK